MREKATKFVCGCLWYTHVPGRWRAVVPQSHSEWNVSQGHAHTHSPSVTLPTEMTLSICRRCLGGILSMSFALIWREWEISLAQSEVYRVCLYCDCLCDGMSQRAWQWRLEIVQEDGVWGRDAQAVGTYLRMKFFCGIGGEICLAPQAGSVARDTLALLACGSYHGRDLDLWFISLPHQGNFMVIPVWDERRDSGNLNE